MSLPSRLSGPAWIVAVAFLLSVQFGAGQGPLVPPGMRLIIVASAAEAEQLTNQLKAGADFAALAKERSIDPTSADGGYLGRIDPAALRPELRAAVQRLAGGQISEVVRIPTGFAILKILPASEALPAINASPNRILAVAAQGAVSYSVAVSGFAEAQTIFLRFPKPAGWNQDLRAVCDIRKRSIPTAIEQLRRAVDGTGVAGVAKESPFDLLQTHYGWAQVLAYQGNLNEAIERWLAAKRIADESVPAMVPEMNRTLGLACLHKSEMDNDLYRAPSDRCLFPPRGDVRLTEPEASERAVKYFLDYLAQKPDDLEVRWLLNLAEMTLGRYPGGVPPRYVVPLSAFESKADIGRFVDVAPEAGLTAFSLAGGVIVDDFENRGLLDVVTSSMDVCEPLHYFRNNGDGTFSERTTEAGLAEQLGGLNIIQADYNNDGCMDILVLRGGWEFPVRKSLLKSNCNGTFSDVTRQSGLATIGTSTQTAVWADIDNDGLLDLFVGREDGPSQLFRNKGDGTFEDISQPSGVGHSAFTKGVVAADYDNDGYVDLYASNYSGDNLLYHNNHDRTFTEVGNKAGVQAPWRSFAAWFFDYDNDGWLDLLVNSYYQSTDEVVRTYLGMPHNAETIKLFKNLRNGTFRDATKEAALDKVFMPMAANFGDVNNDGFLDMYLGMGNPSFAALFPHELLLNTGAGSFVNVTAASGTGELHKGHGIAFADLDRDGDEDIVAEIGGAVPADRHALRVFENPGQSNDWINVRLVGVKTNRAAVGARISLTVENVGRAGDVKTRSIHRTVGSGGSFGANPMELHVGLGASAHIKKVEVWWPASNTFQRFSDVGKNQFLEIREFAERYTKLERRAVRLGGVRR
jgi:FG-GAP-like repeat/PPIC-type PPIASE domain/ASPIC and UnbV